MILPNDTKPENSLYYIGGQIIRILKESTSSIDFMTLYGILKKQRKLSIKVYALTLDWLYLAQVAEIDEKGEIYLVYK